MKISNQSLIALTILGIFGALYLKTKSDFDFQETFKEASAMIKELNPLSSTLIIKVNRYLLTDTITIGKMYLNDEYFCDTLEDTYRGQIKSKTDPLKIYGETAIPNGTYLTEVTYSQAFNKNLPLLYNVPGFEGIRIHTGASIKNTSGCILVGDYKNGNWSLNSNYVNKLVALIPQFSVCKTIVNVVK